MGGSLPLWAQRKVFHRPGIRHEAQGGHGDPQGGHLVGLPPESRLRPLRQPFPWVPWFPCQWGLACPSPLGTSVPSRGPLKVEHGGDWSPRSEEASPLTLWGPSWAPILLLTFTPGGQSPSSGSPGRAMLLDWGSRAPHRTTHGPSQQSLHTKQSGTQIRFGKPRHSALFTLKML